MALCTVNSSIPYSPLYTLHTYISGVMSNNLLMVFKVIWCFINPSILGHCKVAVQFMNWICMLQVLDMECNCVSRQIAYCNKDRGRLIQCVCTKNLTMNWTRWIFALYTLFIVLETGICRHLCREVQFYNRDIYHCCISCSCRGFCIIQEFVSGLLLATKVHPLSWSQRQLESVPWAQSVN
jgi:hypothetical protein